ncbi:MAG TPA: response regulator [Quisquiliibacterium sp.]|nr:response regulator [Quisquiliibacterium sp.]
MSRTRLALVVDDFAPERERIGDILEGAGWRVCSAASGSDALERARSEHPEIIFMDIVMPGMDGFEACRRLADDPGTRSIPVVFVSTKCQRADHVWARMQGGRDLIGKPYTPSQVLGALRHAG